MLEMAKARTTSELLPLTKNTWVVRKDLDPIPPGWLLPTTAGEDALDAQQVQHQQGE